MSAWPELQAAFADYLLHGEQAPALAAGVRSDHIAARSRLLVHRNNVFSSLIDALAELYPVVAQLVGERFFRSVAREYVRTHPPSDPILLCYGEHFPDFLQQLEAARAVPYLADVARLELARHQAYHAADAESLPVRALGGVPQARLGELWLGLHPSIRLLASDYPVSRICELHAGGSPPKPVTLGRESERLLVIRQHYDVETQRLSLGAYALLSSLAEKHTLGKAFEAARAADPHFDLGVQLHDFFDAGAFVDLRMPPTQETKHD